MEQRPSPFGRWSFWALVINMSSIWVVTKCSNVFRMNGTVGRTHLNADHLGAVPFRRWSSWALAINMSSIMVVNNCNNVSRMNGTESRTFLGAGSVERWMLVFLFDNYQILISLPN
jgi:hypothetical protein